MTNEQTVSGLVNPQGLGEEPLYYYTRVFLTFLQGLFEQLDDGFYRWSDDEKLSQISITADVPIPKENVDKIPAIVVMRGPANFANLGLDQMRDIDIRTGKKTRSDLISATMSINCLAKNDVETQRIAWVVARHIRSFKSTLQKIGHIHKVGDELQIGPVSPPGALVSGEAEPELFLVTVFVPFHFMWKETITPLNSKVLRGVESRLQTLLQAPIQNTEADFIETLRPPGIGGRSINNTSLRRDTLDNVSSQIVKT